MSTVHQIGPVELEIKTFKMEIKDVSPEGVIEGYASVFGNVDSHRDIVEPGAFAKTLAEKASVPILYQHNPYEPIGVSPTAAMHEDRKGLAVVGQLALGVQRAAETHELLRMKALQGLSIGYSTIKSAPQAGVRHLKELGLWEWSPVTFPSNELAQATAVKNGLFGIAGLQLLTGMAEVLQKGVSPFGDLPLAPRDHPWDAEAAVQRIEAWAKDSDGDLNMAKFARAFLWFDSSQPDSDHDDGYPDSVDAYKLPIADVVDGELAVIPKAIFAAAAVLQGGRGGVDIPDADQERIRENVAKYYDKMRAKFGDSSIEAPWDTAESKAGRVLSAASREHVERIVTALGDAHAAAQALLTSAEPAEATREDGAADLLGEPDNVKATLRAFADHITTKRKDD